MTSVGIDVSKGKSTVCILKPYGEVVASPYEIQHTEPELHALVSHIQSIEGDVRIVMEATGAYHLPLLSMFKDAGLFVSVINPLAMKRYASTAIRKGKTDKLDSVRIANYGIDNWFRLIENSYQFTVSKRAESNLEEAMMKGNNILGFLNSEGYFEIREGSKCKSVDWYELYVRWCKDNLESPFATSTFVSHLKEHSKSLGIVYDEKCIANCRGFHNVDLHPFTPTTTPCPWDK